MPNASHVATGAENLAIKAICAVEYGDPAELVSMFGKEAVEAALFTLRQDPKWELAAIKIARALKKKRLILNDDLGVLA